MPASAFITWIGENEKALGAAAGAIGAAAVVLWSKLSTIRIPKSWVAEDAKQREAAAAQALPPPAPYALPAPHQLEVDMQSARIQRLHLEFELTTVQDHMRKLRQALDGLTLENAAQSRSLYAARAENEELQAKCRALLEEMARLRRDGPSSAPPRPPTPRRGPNER